MINYDKDIHNLSANWTDCWEFEYNLDTYKRNTKLRDFFNKTFGATIAAAYSTRDIDFDKEGISWDSTYIILVLANSNKIVHLHNSEWAWISVLHKGV